MTATLTAAEATSTTTPDAPAARGSAGSPRIRGMAVGLWGVVGSLLGYGVVMTVLKAAALFT